MLLELCNSLYIVNKYNFGAQLIKKIINNAKNKLIYYIKNNNNNENFKYNKELQHLQMMGFNNIKQSKEILIKHNGNVESAMNELFSRY